MKKSKNTSKDDKEFYDMLRKLERLGFIEVINNIISINIPRLLMEIPYFMIPKEEINEKFHSLTPESQVIYALAQTRMIEGKNKFTEKVEDMKLMTSLAKYYDWEHPFLVEDDICHIFVKIDELLNSEDRYILLRYVFLKYKD